MNLLPGFTTNSHHTFRKTAFISCVLISFNFCVFTEAVSLDLVLSAGDTLRRSSVVYEVSDTSLVQSLCLDAVDSFSNSAFTQLKGITTFRGGPHRDRASYGQLTKRPDSMVVKWATRTKPTGSWGGGAGWTGQPVVVQWPDSMLQQMNVTESFKSAGFTEIIVGSLDGHIYFLDLSTGAFSRNPIDIKNPIKGSVAVDPRGYPILYAGQGINVGKEFGFRIFSLLDQSKLHFIDGRDPFAYRRWAAFDGAALINPKNDRMYLGGENGLIYSLKLNTKFDSASRCVNIAPQTLKYRYKVNESHEQGIENSVAAFQDKIFFADNHGYIQCLDLNTMKPLWIQKNYDDTDATLVIKPECGIPYLYTGNEVDKQGHKGFSYLKKINGNTGDLVWERKFACLTVLGEHPVNGGMLSTPVVGKRKGEGKIIFSISRYNGMNKGLLIALDQKTGETLYEIALDNYAWSSPLDIYDADGNMYIFQADSQGNVMLFDGADGKLIHKLKIADLFEASPVAFDNMIVIPSRPNKIFCLEVK